MQSEVRYLFSGLWKRRGKGIRREKGEEEKEAERERQREREVEEDGGRRREGGRRESSRICLFGRGMKKKGTQAGSGRKICLPRWMGEWAGLSLKGTRQTITQGWDNFSRPRYPKTAISNSSPKIP